MRSTRLSQIGIPAAIVAIVVMMVVPLPTVLLDLLLVCNLAGAVVMPGTEGDIDPATLAA